MDVPSGDSAEDVGLDSPGDATDDRMIPDADPPPMANVAWEREIPIGSYSSPRRGPGRRVLLGYGVEFSLGGALGIRASDGRADWQAESTQELFALPIPIARGEGETPLWVFAGRNGWLLAVDGESGEEIWRFRPYGMEAREAGIFNFYTGLSGADTNADGVQELLVSNGGDHLRAAGEARPPGHLILIDGANGSLLQQIMVPEMRETYTSLVRWERAGTSLIVFGTGGESLTGNLYAVPEASLVAGTLEGLETLVEGSATRGMIAPPSMADLNVDGTLDLIAAPFDGRLVVISGATGETLWSNSEEPGLQETNTSPAVADVDGDGDLDVVHAVQLGTYPMWTGSALRAFDGASGERVWEHLVEGDLILGSPLAMDVDLDGRDEIFFTESSPLFFAGRRAGLRFQVADAMESSVHTLVSREGLNGAAGWLGDIDGDGAVEWILAYNQIDAAYLIRIDLAGGLPARVAWGGYLGTGHNGRY